MHAKLAAATIAGVEAETASVAADNLLGQRQADPRSPLLRREEGVKDLLSDLHGNPGSGVGDGHHQLSCGPLVTRIRPPIGARFALDRAAGAQAMVEAGGALGRVILVP